MAEIFSNDTGNIRVQGLPYGTYLVVETTVPKDLYQAEPYLVVIDRNSPMSAMATPKGSVLTASDSYQKFTVLDEQIEVYLRITKIDEETGKPVLLPGTAFQIYYLDDDGNYRLENGAPKLVRMTDTVNGHLTKNITTFYTNAEGVLTLPEKLPLGKYRIVETTAPNGYYNAWAADASHYVDFTITTDRIYQATGDKNENSMDTLVIGEKYSNHETLGKLTIRKTGEVLTGWRSEPDGVDPWMTGEAESGNFVYETRPLVGAEYTITAAEDIYTQDDGCDIVGGSIDERGGWLLRPGYRDMMQQIKGGKVDRVYICRMRQISGKERHLYSFFKRLMQRGIQVTATEYSLRDRVNMFRLARRVERYATRKGLQLPW